MNSTPSPYSETFARNDKAELRCLVVKDLLDIYDAMSIARGLERYELVTQVLAKQADQWAHEATVVHRVLRGNPTLSETQGGTRASGGGG